MGYAPERTWRVLYEGYGKGMTECICMEKRNGTKKIYEERYVVRNTKTLGKKKQSTNYMLRHGHSRYGSEGTCENLCMWWARCC